MDCAKSKDINELFRMFYHGVWNNIPNKLKGDKKRRPDGRRKIMPNESETVYPGLRVKYAVIKAMN
jgi:hypothetical protein